MTKDLESLDSEIENCHIAEMFKGLEVNKIFTLTTFPSVI